MPDLNCLPTFPSEYDWTFPQAEEAPLSANISLAEAETARQWIGITNAGRSLGEIPIQIFLWIKAHLFSKKNLKFIKNRLIKISLID